jgi:REP element-mobilizing transposase RayT
MGRRGRNNLMDETFFFITTTVVKFIPVFNKPLFCDILISNIKHYREKYKFSILGYVIMLTHFHWIIEVDDEVIRDQKMFWNKLNYIHKNPVKSGLVLKSEDYKYSSARNYAFNDHSVIEVNTELGGIDLYP